MDKGTTNRFGIAGGVLMAASVVAMEAGSSLSPEIITIVFVIGLFCFIYAALLIEE
jgi:hypothetical protein